MSKLIYKYDLINELPQFRAALHKEMYEGLKGRTIRNEVKPSIVGRTIKIIQDTVLNLLLQIQL